MMKNNDELYHYGVPGMRWGVRRADAKVQRVNKRANKRGWSDDATEVAKIRTKKVNQMSNNELNKVNNRKNLERQYSTLNPNVIKKGLAIAGATAAALGTVLALHKNGKQIMELGKNTAEKFKKAKVTHDSKAFWKGMSNAAGKVNEFKNFTFSR